MRGEFLTVHTFISLPSLNEESSTDKSGTEGQVLTGQQPFFGSSLPLTSH
jgi:hypothetical protein